MTTKQLSACKKEKIMGLARRTGWPGWWSCRRVVDRPPAVLGSPQQPALGSTLDHPRPPSTKFIIDPRRPSNEPQSQPATPSRDTRSRARGGPLRWPSHCLARLADDVLVGDELGVCAGGSEESGRVVVERGVLCVHWSLRIGGVEASRMLCGGSCRARAGVCRLAPAESAGHKAQRQGSGGNCSQSPKCRDPGPVPLCSAQPAQPAHSPPPPSSSTQIRPCPCPCSLLWSPAVPSPSQWVEWMGWPDGSIIIIQLSPSRPNSRSPCQS